MSIILIAGVSSLGKARTKVLTTLIGSSLTVWPPEGLPVDEPGRFRDAQEFWVTPEAGDRIVLRFNSNRVFRMPKYETRQTWGWYLSRVYPGTLIRFLLQTDTLLAMLAREPVQAVPGQFPFFLSLLQRAFHDMKHLENSWDCRRAAVWLSSLGEADFLPFKFMKMQEFWEDWDNSTPDSKFRKIRVSILGDREVARKALQKNAVSFWQEVCAKYQAWATGTMSDAERAEMARLVQLWQ